MNAVLTNAVATDQLQRYNAVQRKNAESAYKSNVQYNGVNKKTLEDLEALLLGKNEPESAPKAVVKKDQFVNPDEPKSAGITDLGAGQLKQVALPIGKTLEETITIWRNVRADAISEPEPTTADYQLAAKASANIMRTEAQIALHNLAKRMRESGNDAQTLSSKDAGQATQLQLLFNKAASSYSFQNDMKKSGFQIGWPEFYKSA